MRNVPLHCARTLTVIIFWSLGAAAVYETHLHACQTNAIIASEWIYQNTIEREYFMLDVSVSFADRVTATNKQLEASCFPIDQ